MVEIGTSGGAKKNIDLVKNQYFVIGDVFDDEEKLLTSMRRKHWLTLNILWN